LNFSACGRVQNTFVVKIKVKQQLRKRKFTITYIKICEINVKVILLVFVRGGRGLVINLITGTWLSTIEVQLAGSWFQGGAAGGWFQGGAADGWFQGGADMVSPLNSIVRAPFERTDDESLGRNYRALGGANVLLGMSICNGRRWSCRWISSRLILYRVALLRRIWRRVGWRWKWPE
jgi:hypothetical protein